MQKKTVAIISDSWAGPLLAAYLEQSGHKVTLIEIGESLKLQPHARIDFPFIPASDMAVGAVAKLAELFPTFSDSQIFENPPLTVEDGTIKPFIGFGESKSEALQPLSWLNHLRQLTLRESPFEKLSELFASLKIQQYDYSELTRIEFTGSKIEKIVINGTQDILADQFVFLAAPKDLIAQLPAEYINSRTRSRVTKSALWARVAIELEHSAPLFDGQNLFFLIPNQPEQDPCVGSFIQSQDASGAVRFSSIWETYINNNYNDDSEYVSTCLRNMRKLIRKNFPAIDTKPKEVITITPFAAADSSWTLEQKEFQQIADNFVFYPNLAVQTPGMARCIISASEAYALFLAKSLSPNQPNITPSLLTSEASC